MTEHVRHRSKYLDMPVAETQAFAFAADGRPVARARTLKALTGLLHTLPAEVIEGHLRRHDFSQWIDGVFRDHPLAAHLRGIEERVDTDGTRDLAESVTQAIRARYETAPDRILQPAASQAARAATATQST
jgi:hypothetical protein